MRGQKRHFEETESVMAEQPKGARTWVLLSSYNHHNNVAFTKAKSERGSAGLKNYLPPQNLIMLWSVKNNDNGKEQKQWH